MLFWAAGFVRVEGCRYELTGHGREFLKQYRRFHERDVRAQKLLEALGCERKKLALSCDCKRTTTNVFNDAEF